MQLLDIDGIWRLKILYLTLLAAAQQQRIMVVFQMILLVALSDLIQDKHSINHAILHTIVTLFQMATS